MTVICLNLICVEVEVETLSEREIKTEKRGGWGRTHSYVWVRGEDGWVGVYRTGLIVFVQFLRESHPVAPVCHLVSVEEGLMKSVCVRRGRVGGGLQRKLNWARWLVWCGVGVG